MLRQLRSSEKMKRVLWGGLLIVIIPSFVVFYGWGDYSRAGSTGVNTPLATINYPDGKSSTLTFADLESADSSLKNDIMFYLQSEGMYMDQNALQSVVDNKDRIDEAINKAIVNKYAEDNNLDVSANEAMKFVQERTTPERRMQIAQDMQAQGRTIDHYIEAVRNELLQNRVEAIVGGQVRATENEAWTAYRKENEKIVADFLRVNASDFRSSVTLEDKAVEDYFQANIKEFQVPDQVNYSFVLVTKDDLKSSATVSNDDITSYYASQKETFKTAQKARLRQILLKQKTADDVQTTAPEAIIAANAEVRKTADSILQRVKGGEDFAALADQFTQETNFPMRSDVNTTASDAWTSAGGNLGMISEVIAKSTYGDTWTSEVFSLKPGDVSSVIETPTGFHIVKLEEKVDAEYQSIDAVRPVLEDMIRTEKSAELFNELGDKLAELKETHTGLNQIANAAGLSVRKSPNVNKTDSFIPEIGMLGPEFLEEIRSLEKGAVSELLSDTQRHLIIQIEEEIPAHDPDFAAVKSVVEESYKNFKARELAKEHAEKIKSQATDLAALEKFAIDNGTTVTKSQPFTRREAGSVLGPVPNFEAVSEDIKTGDILVSGIGADPEKPTSYIVWIVSELQEPSRDEFVKVLPAQLQQIIFEKQKTLFYEFLREQRSVIKDRIKMLTKL